MPVLLPNKAAGLSALFFSLVCLGTWPALLKLCSDHGRHPVHSYLDYSLAVFVVCAALSLTLGHFGDSDMPAFPEQLLEPNGPLALVAVAGGALLMAGNLSMQRSLLLGVPLGIVLPVQASLCVVIGTSMNYFLQPEKNDPALLSCGVAAFLLAILLSTASHFLHAEEVARAAKPSPAPGQWPQDYSVMSSGSGVDGPGGPRARRRSSLDSRRHRDEMFLLLPQARVSHPCAGYAVAVFGGLCFGFFTPAFNLAVNDEYGWVSGRASPLTPWTANFYFDLSFCVSAMIANLWIMYHPGEGDGATSVGAWLRDGGSGRWLAGSAGALCCVGNTAQFLGGAAAGFASADLVQAFPIVGTAWGILLFQEFRDASPRVVVLLSATYAVYIAAVVLMSVSVE